MVACLAFHSCVALNRGDDAHILESFIVWSIEIKVFVALRRHFAKSLLSLIVPCFPSSPLDSLAIRVARLASL